MSLLLANPYLTVPIALLALAIVALFLRNAVHERLWLGITGVMFGGLLLFDLGKTLPYMEVQTFYEPDPVLDNVWMMLLFYAMIPTSITLAAWLESYRLITGQPRLHFFEAIMPTIFMFTGAVFTGVAMYFITGGSSYLDNGVAAGGYIIGFGAVLAGAYAGWITTENASSQQKQRHLRLQAT